jgi:hypothetical protein
MTTPHIPAAWNDAEILDGMEIVDKATLKGVPFLVTGLTFRTNDKRVNFVYVDGERADGSTFTFNDSSSGVRAQLVSYLAERGLSDAVDSGETVPVRIVAPLGVRVSEYDTEDDNGRPKRGKTYYLTTSGKRAGVPAETPVTSPAPATTAAKPRSRRTTAK